MKWVTTAPTACSTEGGRCGCQEALAAEEEDKPPGPGPPSRWALCSACPCKARPNPQNQPNPQNHPRSHLTDKGPKAPVNRLPPQPRRRSPGTGENPPPPRRDLTQDSAAPSGANSPLGRTPQEQGAPLCSSLNQVDLGVLRKEITCHQDSLLCGVMIANCTTLGARPWPLSGSPGDNRDT